MSVPPSLTPHGAAAAPDGATAGDPVSYVAVDPSDITAFLTLRQADTFRQPNMNETSDVFAVKSFSGEALKKLLEEVEESTQPDDEDASFWLKFVSTEDPELNKMIVDGTLQKKLAAGITHEYKGLVYLRFLRVTYQLTSYRYTNLANKTASRDNAKIDALDVSAKTKSALKVFSYYINEISANGTTGIDSAEILDTAKITDFMFEVSRYLSPLPNMTEQRLLYIFLKLNKLMRYTSGDEWAYKIGRSLEDLASDSYLHVSKQGIDLNRFFKKQLYTFFHDSIDNGAVIAMLLDFTIFQGLDYWSRFFVYLFQRNTDEIVKVFGSELNEYLHSQRFFGGLDESVFAELETIKPRFINYENEYHLSNVNSLSNNNNELLNSHEINEDLKRQIEDLKSQLESLRTTHTEILSQSKDYEAQVAEAQKQRDLLVEEYNKVKAEHDTLSMKSNLDNTINANEEFSERNKELQAQIAALKTSLEKKNAKLAKHAA